MRQFSPIAVFCYNRPDHVKRLIESIAVNPEAKDTDLYIFSDGHKCEDDRINVSLVRSYLKNISGFRKIMITESNKNRGSSESVITGVTRVLKDYEDVIVLEDDLFVSKDFLKFMNDALLYYRENQNIHSITGYQFPDVVPGSYKNSIYLLPRNCATGWATWRDRWQSAIWDMDYFPAFFRDKEKRKAYEIGGQNLTLLLLKQYMGLHDAWDIRWDYNRHLKNSYVLYSTLPKVINLGNDGSGTNDSKWNKVNKNLVEGKVELITASELDPEILLNSQNYFRLSFVKKIYFLFLTLLYYSGWKSR